MTVPDAEEIISLSDDRVASFIQAHAAQRTLSVVMKQLNADLLNGDALARDRAADAIHRLGFSLRP